MSVMNNTKEEISRITSDLESEYEYAVDQHGRSVVIKQKESVNPAVERIKGPGFEGLIRKLGIKRSIAIFDNAVGHIKSYCHAQALLSERIVVTFHRVACIPGGIEIDLGDAKNNRIQISAQGVKIITSGSKVLFLRTPVMECMVQPSEEGQLTLLDKYLNLDQEQCLLLIGWMSYTLAHPKLDTTSYPILVLIADQGAGKTFLSKVVIRSLVDPSKLGVQGYPSNKKDLVLAGQNAYLLVYDNLRYLSPEKSDHLCMAVTGGSISARQLYSDEEIVNHQLHSPLVLNGIHEFIDQPDLAQRCITIRLNPMSGHQRKSETTLLEEFNADLPAIFRGLLDLISEIFKVLPDVKVANPERLIDFSRWLAGMEQSMGEPDGSLQSAYSQILKDSQRDSLMENPVADAVYQMMTEGGEETWTGTSSKLLVRLTDDLPVPDYRVKRWPTTPSSLSKQLKAVKAALLSQNIKVEFTRGKERRITITNLEAF